MHPTADIPIDAGNYSKPMSVTAVRRYPAYPELFVYPLCPGCDLLMEREYQSFCDRCGQALIRKGFS